MDLQEFSKHLDGHRGDSSESLDGQLENDCIQLLAQLESMIERLPSSNEKDAELVRALEIAKEMLVVVLDFVTLRFGHETVASSISQVCELRDSAKDLQMMLTRGFWKSLLPKKTPQDPLTQHAYRQLGKEFAEVLSSTLGLVDSHYTNHTSIAEWRAGCAIMIDEFRQGW
jgi:hypothetical protein